MKTLAIVIAVLGILGLFAITNPSMDDYRNYIRKQVITESQKGPDATLGQVLGPMLGGLAGSLLAGQTIRDDYVFFSVYELSLGKKRFRVLGIFKNFFIVETPK